MYDDDGILLFVAGMLLGIFVWHIITSGDYKQGQVDALTGKIRYELIVNEDSTKTWERIEE